jgi:hypothetical protein
MRTYNLTLRISNGVDRVYSVRKLSPSDLPSPFVRGFDLYEQTQNPKRRYRVMLAGCGAINCTCPQWQKTERCKHADCLAVAGLLDVDFATLVRSRTELLDDAIAEIDAIKKDLNAALDEVAALDHGMLAVAAELETLKKSMQPKRRGRPRKAA